MGDFLAELFDQFDQEERARIRAAEASTIAIVAQGAAAVNRRQLAESLHDSYWVLQPENDARIDSAGVVFVAYVNALWRKTDAARAECIHDFLAKVENLIGPVLTRYGREGKDLIDELRAECDINAWQVHSMLPTSPSCTTSSKEDSAAGASEDGTDHAGGHSEATDANEQSEAEGCQSDAKRPVISIQLPAVLEFSDSWRKRMRRNADRSAQYARHLGRNGPEVGRQEDLLKDARVWAAATLTETVSEVQDVRELRERVVKQTWDQFVPKHRYYSDFRLGYREFQSALWEEGWPSLEDCALAEVIERADSAGNVPEIPADSAPLTARSRPGVAQGPKRTGAWLRIALRFRGLQKACDGKLEARWFAGGRFDGSQWLLAITGGPVHGIDKKFERIARSATKELGYSGARASVDRWLDLLKRDGPNLAIRESTTTAIIGDVCGASADYCRRRDARQFETAAREQAELDGGPPAPGLSTSDPLVGWIPAQRVDWREDAADALECPPFLRPVKAARLDAIAKLRKDAADVIQRTKPQGREELERCLWPVFSEYAQQVFDKIAGAELEHWAVGRDPEDYAKWLRSECSASVVADVCGPIRGQFYASLRYVAEIVGEVSRPPELVRMRHVLWLMIAEEVVPGPSSSTKRLESRLIGMLLEETIPHWEARAAQMLQETVACADSGETPAPEGATPQAPFRDPEAKPDEEITPDPARLDGPPPSEHDTEVGLPSTKDAHVALLEAILEKRPTTLEKWAGDHRFGRTTVFDWKAARAAGKSLKGRVSGPKIAAIEKAIKDDAEALGLSTRTRSD